MVGADCSQLERVLNSYVKTLVAGRVDLEYYSPVGREGT
jgi:hypothetical protein